MSRRWRFQPHDSGRVQDLVRRLRVSPLVAQVLVARGYDADSAETFLGGSIMDLHDPDLLPGVPEAADRMIAAMQAGRRITIYGDYDVDGVTSTSLLWHCLKLQDANVDYYIPSRLDEGYGINSQAIRQLHEEDPERLMVSVDCGITSVADAQLAKELGLELIITDHHNFDGELPDACLVHPRLPGSKYPFGDLCGVGVAFKLAWAICKRKGNGKATPRMKKFLMAAVGLTAIGTVADLVPLTGENRVIVQYGLRSLLERPSLGMKSLLGISNLTEKKQLDAEDIGFGIGPRINAAGRLGQARLAVELLTTNDPERAKALSDYLDQLNKQRRTVERRIFKQAKELVEENPEWKKQPALVLAHEDWHPGVIGIVASRVVEHFRVPTVLISQQQGDPAPGSGRSYAGFDLYTGFQNCSQNLVTFGGHRAAAGLKIHAKDIDAFRTEFVNYVDCTHIIDEEHETLRIDAEVRLADVNFRSVRNLGRLGPFGMKNPQPRFAATNVELNGPPRTMGEGDRHLALKLKQYNTSMRAVAFGRGEWAAELEKVNGPISICFAPIVSSFRGFERVELRLIDWKAGNLAEQPKSESELGSPAA